MKIEIDLEDYIRLVKRDFELDMLECMGVDNFNGYSDAMEEYEDGIDEIESEIRNKYKEMI